MSEIDPVRFGQMINAMEGLEKALASTASELEKVDERLEKLDGRLGTVEDRFRLGKAGLIGLAVGLGFALYGVKETLQALWDKV